MVQIHPGPHFYIKLGIALYFGDIKWDRWIILILANIFFDIIFSMKIAIVYKERNKKAEEIVPKAIEYLKNKNVEVAADGKIEGSDYIVAFGGDGTIIHKSCAYVELGIPLVGINTGTLGFLAAVEAGEWKEALDKILDKKSFSF